MGSLSFFFFSFFSTSFNLFHLSLGRSWPDMTSLLQQPFLKKKKDITQRFFLGIDYESNVFLEGVKFLSPMWLVAFLCLLSGTPSVLSVSLTFPCGNLMALFWIFYCWVMELVNIVSILPSNLKERHWIIQSFFKTQSPFRQNLFQKKWYPNWR